MKRTLLALLLLAVVGFICLGFGGNTHLSNDIEKAMLTGEVGTLIQHFDSHVDLGFKTGSTHCTRTEAAKLFGEFLRQNPPADFACDSHRNFVSASLTTADGRQYKVDYTLRTINNEQLITGLYVY